MNIIITSSKLQYKANDGGVTRRIPEHFVKRSVVFEIDGEERRMDIEKAALPSTATESEVISYILENTDKSTIANRQLKEIQNIVERIKTATELYQENKDKMALLEDLKALRVGKLKEECSQAIYDGFFVGENHFGFNEHDQTNFTQQLLLIVSGHSSPIQWKTKNKGVVEFSVNAFRAICQAAEVHKRAQQEKYWALEQQINSAEDRDEVKEVVWS